MLDIAFPLRAPHGRDLNTRGWLQEAALRCLLNNLDPEVAEDPENLADQEIGELEKRREPDGHREPERDGATDARAS